MSDLIAIKNATEIVEKNPNTSAKMIFWLNPDLKDLDKKHLETMLTYAPRIFYDFFDEQKLHISISYAGSKFGWVFDLHQDDSHIFESEYFTTREEAEEAAFTKAIEILENAESKTENKIETSSN